jgi:hypothetical protein
MKKEINWIKRLFSKTKEVAVLPAGKTFLAAKKNQYICDCVLKYDGNAVRRVKFEISAYTRRHAEEQIRNKMKIEVLKTYQNKKK